MASPTAETIIGLARDVLREESGSDVPVIGESFMLTALSDGNLKWARAHNKGNPLVFQRETGFDLFADTALAEAITTATTDFDVDSATNLDSSGVVIVWDENMPDFVSYTGKTSNNLTGVTGIGFAHEDGDIVQKIYALPSNFASFRESPTHGDGVLLNGIPLKYMNGVPVAGYFSIYDDGTNKYLILPRGSTGSASVFYNKTSTTIDSTDDTVDVPEEFQFFLVWHLVAFAYMGREQDANKMLFAQNESNKLLQEALRNRNTGKKIRTRPLGRITRDYTTVNGFYFPLDNA